jgi:acyl dehydratase
MTLTFEDFPPGHFGTFGPRRVTREEILAFAAEFDPQPMHLDEAAASRSMLKGLSASGWHLCSLMMRMSFVSCAG